MVWDTMQLITSSLKPDIFFFSILGHARHHVGKLSD
jgi:hypothetical protein